VQKVQLHTLTTSH